jgi:hypothetical protein
MSGIFRTLRSIGRLSLVTSLLLILAGVSPAGAFDYDSYAAADLDTLAIRKPALGLGVDIVPARSVRLDVTLVAQAASCPSKIVKWAMRTSGIARDVVASTDVTQCIKVKSAKGRQYVIFIQDALAESLDKAVKPGGKLTIYASLVYAAPRGPGLVVNAFSPLPAPEKPTEHSAVDLSTAIRKK